MSKSAPRADLVVMCDTACRAEFVMRSKPMLLLALLIASTIVLTGTSIAQETTTTLQETITTLMTNDLAGSPGKEVMMYTVEFPPGAQSPVHRHNAQVSVYVLEGSVVMQVKGGQERTLTPGETFYEGPTDVHTVSRNASSTQPAKLLVFTVKDKGAPLLVLEK